MIATVIVLGSAALATALSVAWFLSPELRAWLEQPKHRFQAAVQQYDRSVDDLGRIGDPHGAPSGPPTRV
jgi:hypothetical protein